MNSLPRYMKSGKARFDFRVPDGLGNWVYPDWDDPNLKVEFYDSGSTLRATATVGGDPALTQGDDYDADDNPDGGKFVAIEDVDLADFDLGLAEAKVYAEVSDTQVLPYPSIVEAFEVVADAGEGPLYSTVDRVKDEAPGAWPDSVTDDMVTLAIADASRKIDAFLGVCYDVPFPDIGGDPATPAVIETICRKLAAYQCLIWMGRVNAVVEEGLAGKAMSELLGMVPANGKAPLVRIEGYSGPVSVYQGSLTRGDLETGEDALA